MNYVLMADGSIISENALCHHGVKGQKWGVRRYQNLDGSLTAAGKKRQAKRIQSNKAATIAKGTTLYRISANDKTDANSGKIYVNTSNKAADFYITELGSSKVYQKGKAFAHEYITKTDLNLPSKKAMEKIELGLLNDKDVQRELVDSLMKKGYSREAATAKVQPYRAGKAFIQKTGQVALTTLAAGFGIIITPGNSGERQRALNATRISYGDVNNKLTNKKLRDALADKGYNAMKDYNDRRAYGKKGKDAVIVFDSEKNIASTKISEVTATDYGKAYARAYLDAHPKSKLEFNDLVKDGEAKYKSNYEQGVIARNRAALNKAILEEEKKKKQ